MLLMRNFDYLNFDFPVKIISWRLIPLIIGINALLKKDYINGTIAVLVAIVFYIPDFLTPAERIQYYKLWPLLLVGVGLTILAKYLFPEKLGDSWTTQHLDYNYIHESNVMAGSSKKLTSKEFIGGKVLCLMGGSEINLAETELKEGANIKVNIVMGGVGLVVPKEWNIKLEVLPMMGGVDDQINKFPGHVVDPEKKLVISGFVLMGGVDIKRV